MKILISNDDGIESLGIYNLISALKEIADVTVVAPIREQSAAGHSITMQNPLRVVKYYKNGDFLGYAVDGTPADCVKMGVRNIMNEMPDLVVSGINHGSNTATNIIYSGTVSAAREAAIMDIPAIAISVTSHDANHFEAARKIVQKVALEIFNKGLKKGTLLNINVPNIPESEIKGTIITKQGKSKWDDIYEKRQDPNGRDYYWLTGNFINLDNDLSFDEYAVKNNFISITPIHFDLTDYEVYEKILNSSILEKTGI
ncbi:MAG: 5'/3'-nucleotidase SurE [Ignavibacterium sp.]